MILMIRRSIIDGITIRAFIDAAIDDIDTGDGMLAVDDDIDDD
jgi:hypothetical protein